jgi:ribonuclease HII
MITLGIDEVGRGCWAGPLVAGAVILSPKEGPIKGLRDSKKLTKSRREQLAAEIHTRALAVGIGWVDPTEIDALGLTRAVGLAMERALAKIDVKIDEIIIDGNINYFARDVRAKAIVRADDSVPCVSAASIVAKVARDAYMAKVSEQYAGYGFAQHVGYGTATHIAALKSLGVTDIHRRSYKPVRALLV